jgi:ribokinase
LIVRDIVVVGDVMLDVVVKTLADRAPTSDTPSRVRFSRGGSAANIAEALAAAGHHVTYVGACGSDLAAQLFADALRVVGVDLALERVEAATGVVVALVGDDAQRAMMTDRGANSMLDLEHVLRQLEAPFDHLHVSGYTFLDPMTSQVAHLALERARELGRSTSIDVCSIAPLIEMTPAEFLKATAGASMLFANEEEALIVSGASDISVAFEILGPLFDEVVITRGESGARARGRGADHEVISMSDHVVDTTGAGDAATGAYLALRLRDGAIDEALEAAMSAASLVVGGIGSRGQSHI